MSPHENDTEHETVNRESHPNAGGPQGLAGDMGVSSERTGPFEGVEGTGTSASAQGRTDGETTTVPEGELDHPGQPVSEVDAEETPQDKPDETAAATDVDRTVGEVQPDPVRSHEFDPSRNPGHGGQ